MQSLFWDRNPELTSWRATPSGNMNHLVPYTSEASDIFEMGYSYDKAILICQARGQKVFLFN